VEKSKAEARPPILLKSQSQFVDPRGRPYYWIGPVREAGEAEPGTDVAALSDNKVSITPIYLNLTNIPVLGALRAS